MNMSLNIETLNETQQPSKAEPGTREVPLPTPAELRTSLPVPAHLQARIRQHRDAIRRILNGEDPRTLVVVGPCSIHDEVAALEYGEKLKALADDVSDRFLIVMRTYLEKPRTTVGWKGLLYDPERTGSGNLNEGLLRSRRLLLNLSDMGLPLATEALSPFAMDYLGDLVSWTAIGARTTESQVHREMVSGLPMPTGFKNGTDGSIGVAILGEDADNSTDLMRFADMALYKSKQSGRNTYHYFSEKLERKLFEKRKLLAELEAAIEGDQLELHYQPQHDMKSRKIVGVEALIRWPLPGGEYRYPDLFIPLAEEGELIFSLGEWIIKRACKDGRQLLDRAGPLTIAINLSSKQFKDPNLKEMIVHHCKQYQIPHHCIELEITESLLLSNINEAANMLGKLRMEGFNISLDDFGTGYSSNFYLKSIPVTGIKIDRLFTAGIPFEKKDTAIVETTIDLATRLDLKVIAEGVETEEQFNHLLGFGCEVAQGYLLNKPMPMTELIAQITETRKIREHNIQRITR